MKKFLLRFFQVLCLIQLMGQGQLDAHTAAGSLYSSSVSHHQWSEHASLIALQYKSSVAVKSYTSRSPGIIRLIAENVYEETDELFVFKKPLETNPCITAVFYNLLPDYLHHDNKNSVAFCNQLSFASVNKKHITFRVFRV